MAKIYTSYKYRNASVRPLPGIQGATVRQYVDLLQSYLDEHEHINKGEEDDEDLSSLSEERIAELLYARIYDSTITIVLVSKNMMENKREKDQWIPREISYSLTEHSRGGRTSHTNAVLAVVIPDENGSYDHFIQDNTCPECHCRSLQTFSVFEIIRNNIFNHKEPARSNCSNHHPGNKPYMGYDHSYIHSVKWDDFISDINTYINIAIKINENINNYDIQKDVTRQ